MAHLPELVIADDGRQVTPLVYAPLSYRSSDGRFEMKVDTEYPRNGIVDFRTSAKSARIVRLPVPGWCREWSLSVDGHSVSAPAENGFLKIGIPASGEMAIRLELKMEFVRKACDIDGRRYAEYLYGPLVLVRDTGFGGCLGEELPEDIRFERQPDGGKVFAMFAGKDGIGRTHTLVDYAHACRRSPDSDEFEVFIPQRRK